jgi:uncharacterized membrane protein HdeD (DUF308 family)
MIDSTSSATALERIAGAWWVLLLLGLLGIAAGVIVIALPGISLTALAWVSGVYLLFDGLLHVVASLSRQAQNRGLTALFGVLSVVAGLFLVRHPIAGVVGIAVLLGIWFVAFGLVRFIDAFDRPEGRTWQLLLAVLEVIVGVIIVASPDIGVASLALIVGVGYLLRGIATAAIAWGLRSARTP